MQSVPDGASGEDLAAADRLVRITNALIELQRELLEHLHETGHDLTSAKTVFDSLLDNLARCVAHRHRLRTTGPRTELLRDGFAL